MNHIYHIYFPVLVHQGHKEGTMWFGIFFPPDPEGLLCGEDCAFQVNIQKTALRRQRKHRLIFYWTERIISVYCWFMDVRHKHLHDRSKVCWEQYINNQYGQFLSYNRCPALWILTLKDFLCCLIIVSTDFKHTLCFEFPLVTTNLLQSPILSCQPYKTDSENKWSLV